MICTGLEAARELFLGEAGIKTALLDGEPIFTRQGACVYLELVQNGTE